MTSMRFGAVVMLAAAAFSPPLAAQQMDGPKGRWIAAAMATGTCAVWHYDPAKNEKLEWQGACVGGKAQGRGIVISTIAEDGRRFVTRSEGEMRAGIMSGRVVSASNEGSRLEVDYVGGAPNGRGVFTMGKTRYDGEFKNGAFHGKGVIVFDNGDRYEGDFVDTKFHGRGTYTAADGTRRSGNWVDGAFVGP